MRRLIDDVFVSGFGNPFLAPLEDQALLELAPLLGVGDRLAFTTDSYVVDPLFFAGGDIGTLAVAGTVNDLAMAARGRCIFPAGWSSRKAWRSVLCVGSSPA